MAKSTQPCSIGQLKGSEEECHKLTYKPADLIAIDALENEEKKIILYRADLLSVEDEVKSICAHHKVLLIEKFSFLQKECCDPFHSHKKKRVTKYLQEMNVTFCHKLSECGVTVIPGKKVCGNCKTKLNNLMKRAVEIQDSDIDSNINDISIDISSSDSEEIKDLSYIQLNSSLTGLEESPLKLSGLARSSKCHYGKRKLASAHQQMTKKMAKALDISPNQIAIKCSEEGKNDNLLKQKAADLDILVNQIKDKISKQGTTRAEKIQLLTAAPNSWSRRTVAQFFGVTEHMAKAAKTLSSQNGIFSKPCPKKGRPLNAETRESILNFYCDDENTRVLPGTRDKVSVARNVHQQKRLILCTLKELYQLYKAKEPGMTVGFSTFAALRPKWCVLAGSAGTHSVCARTIHQNVKLMSKSGHPQETYHDLIDMMVCDAASKDCMLQRCGNCPPATVVSDFLENQFNDRPKQEITFHQWVTTDRTEMFYQKLEVPEFIDLLVEKLIKLLPHSFVAKQQSQYFKHRKETMEEGTVLILLDFSENYAFHMQDEAQGYHWAHKHCTVHPVVCYFKNNDKLCHHSLCFLSNDLTHDVAMVYEIQRETIKILKRKNEKVIAVEYFSDGCAAQYKNYKNFLNLCTHFEDFGVQAKWTFFATSHGKSACDGVGGTVKRSAALESLRRPHNPIIDLSQLLAYCKNAMTTIYFNEIRPENLEASRQFLKDRFSSGSTIKGTRSFHYFEPISQKKILVKRISNDSYSYEFNVGGYDNPNSTLNASIKEGGYIAVTYDGCWYIALTLKCDTENGDVKVTFLHPAGPAPSFHFPCREDICWVPLEHVLCCIDPPALANSRGHYQLSCQTIEMVSQAWQNFRK